MFWNTRTFSIRAMVRLTSYKEFPERTRYTLGRKGCA